MNSAAYEVSEWPSESIAAWVRRRAEEFCKARDIECTGVRWVVETIATETRTERSWPMNAISD